MTDKAKRPDRDEAEQNRQAGQVEEVRAARGSDDGPTAAAPTESDATETLEGGLQPKPGTKRSRPRRAQRKPATRVTPAASVEQGSEAVKALETIETIETIEAVEALDAVEAIEAVGETPLITTLETDMSELEAQGFTADEALRLIDITRRLETSAEARESQAELKRLRFTQWLIEHGILNEFSA